VTSEEFMVLWGQPDLRQYIIDAAKRQKKDEKKRKNRKNI